MQDCSPTVQDCSHTSTCTLSLDIAPEFTCFDNFNHSLAAAVAAVALLMYYPSAAVSRAYFQLMDAKKTIYHQQLCAHAPMRPCAHALMCPCAYAPMHPCACACAGTCSFSPT